MQKLFHRKHMIKLPIIIFLLIIFHLPAFGETVYQEINPSEFKVLSNGPKTCPFFTFIQNNRQAKSFLSVDGFVLYELITIRNTKLNVCFIKKDITTKPILDLKRLFFEFTLNF
jgi:hypothetical protein